MPPVSAADPSAPDLSPILLPGLGDWQGSSQDLRAGLFLQELHEDALLFATLEPGDCAH
jgi:hypothetical protein